MHPEGQPQVRQGRLWWWFTNFRTDVIVLHVPPWEGEPTARWPPDLLRRFEEGYSLDYASGGVQVYRSSRGKK